MRRLIPIDTNATAPASLLPPSPLSSSSSAPSASPTFSNYSYDSGGTFLFPSIRFIDSAFDIATLSLISCLLLLSILSLSFIFYLRLKSRRSHHLQNFNSLWFVRLLLASSILVWSLNEILRLPFFHRRYLYPFLPNLTLSSQSLLCKIHTVLSVGFLEPGFLITLLFLLNVSIKKRNPPCPVGIIILTCCPVLILQTFFVFFAPFQSKLPDVFYTSSVLSIDSSDNKILMCRYPLFSSIVFAAFGIVYSLGFLFSYWRVVSLVINKGTRVRIHALAFSVLSCLPIQVLFLALSSFWSPENLAHGGMMFGKFFSMLSCAAVGEGILVIRPIADALSAGGYCFWCKPGVRWLRPAEEESHRGLFMLSQGRFGQLVVSREQHVIGISVTEDLRQPIVK